MLAIDIEMRLMNWQVGQNLSQRFLNTYLQEAREKPEEVWPLVEYYMAEKSMVYVSISTLYDKHLDLGEKYLQVALTHAHTLEKLIRSSPQASFTI